QPRSQGPVLLGPGAVPAAALELDPDRCPAAADDAGLVFAQRIDVEPQDEGGMRRYLLLDVRERVNLARRGRRLPDEPGQHGPALAIQLVAQGLLIVREPGSPCQGKQALVERSQVRLQR